MSSRLSERRNLGRRLAGVTMPISRKRTKWGRNYLCLCGSGLKYKHCCMSNINDLTIVDGNAGVEKLSEDIQKMIDAQVEKQEKGGSNSHG